MADHPGMTILVCFAVPGLTAAGIYALTYGHLRKRDRYRLIRTLILSVLVATALLATGDPMALTGLAAQVLDRPDG